MEGTHVRVEIIDMYVLDPMEEYFTLMAGQTSAFRVVFRALLRSHRTSTLPTPPG